MLKYHRLLIGSAVLCLYVCATAARLYAEMTVKVAASPRPAPLATPETFSDADESPASGTTVELETVGEPSAPGGASQLLQLRFNVQKNSALGYEYAGVAFPFVSPQQVESASSIQFYVRPKSAMSLQINLRDADKQNGFGPQQKLVAGEWQVVKTPITAYAGLDLNAIESFAISIATPSSGELDIAMARFPVKEKAVDQNASAATGAAGSAAYHFDFAKNPPNFEKPVMISDKDESASSMSNTEISFPLAELPSGGSANVLQLEFTVAENAALGYEYAGVAFPFSEPLALAPDGSFTFQARAGVPITELELVLRDASKQRATVRLAVPASNTWQKVSQPASAFRGIDTRQVQSAAIVILSETRGVLQIADLRLPVNPQTERTRLYEDISSKPRWHTDLEMARTLAGNQQKPLLVLYEKEDSEATLARINEDPVWRQLLGSSVCLRLDADSSDAVALGFDAPPTDSALVVYTPSGEEKARATSFETEEAGRLLRLNQQ
jgi:hypothetical protein